MSGHTPGPWVVVFTKWGDVSVEAPSAVSSLGGTTYPICEDVNGDSRAGATTGRPIDNANLIAAAPDLLEALIAVLNYCVDDEGQPTIATARAAIAKATGDQP